MRSSLALLVLTVAAAACAAPAEDGEDSAAAFTTDLRPELAQMNDVSILFPLATSKGAFDRGYLTPASAGRGGALITSEVYEKAFGPPGTLLGGGTSAAPKLAGLRLVAVRFDPCFAELQIRDESKCKNQIRLVFQTLSFDGKRTTAKDDAVHAFYSITRAELEAAVGKMIALRTKKVGEKRLGALGPHPLLKTTGGDLDVATAAEVEGLVTSLAGPKNLVQFTQFATSAGGLAWNFSGFDTATGAFMPIPGLPAARNTRVAFFAGFETGTLSGEPAFNPASEATGTDNLQALGNETSATAVGAATRAQGFQAMLRLENPTKHSPDTTDCASCHAVEPIRKLVATKLFAGEMEKAVGAFAPDARFVPAEDLKQAANEEAGVDMHMFSYNGRVPSVHRRTINETAAVVAHLNARR